MRNQWYLLFILFSIISCQPVIENENREKRATYPSIETPAKAEYNTSELHTTLTAIVIPTPITPTNTPPILIPRVPEPKEGEMLVYPTAQFIGQLVQDGRCIRLQLHFQSEAEEQDISYLVIWPPDYYYENIEGKIHILNGNRDVRAIVGETVELGGGLMPVRIESQMESIIKELCRGPYLFGW